MEVGRRFDIGEAFVEPQARVEGAWADSDSYIASDGLAVHENEESSFRGSLGVRVGYHFDADRDTALEPYTRVAVVNEFLGDDVVETDDTVSDARLSGLGIEAEAGVSVRVDSSLYVYSQYQYSTSIDSDRISSPWGVDAGFRMMW